MDDSQFTLSMPDSRQTSFDDIHADFSELEIIRWNNLYTYIS